VLFYDPTTKEGGRYLALIHDFVPSNSHKLAAITAVEGTGRTNLSIFSATVYYKRAMVGIRLQSFMCSIKINPQYYSQPLKEKVAQKTYLTDLFQV
jgi:hypothetical protein